MSLFLKKKCSQKHQGRNIMTDGKCNLKNAPANAKRGRSGSGRKYTTCQRDTNAKKQHVACSVNPKSNTCRQKKYVSAKKKKTSKKKTKTVKVKRSKGTSKKKTSKKKTSKKKKSSTKKVKRTSGFVRR